MTPPQNSSYDDLLRIWHAADEIPQIDHAWLSDHLMTPTGRGPTYESWTLLSALASQTHRLRVGVMVTSNRFRPPAVLAKIAATVDIISGGRLNFGIGAGSRPGHPLARREYQAHGLAFDNFAPAAEALDEALIVIKKLWTETEPFDFTGRHLHLTGALGEPRPLQQPLPPILVGGRSISLLRIAAAHADIWNIVGGDTADAAHRSELLSQACRQIGRDPASIIRSIHLPVSYTQPELARQVISEAIQVGFTHIVIGLPDSPPRRAARWVVDELIDEFTS